LLKFLGVAVCALFIVSCAGEQTPAKRSGTTHLPLVDGRIYEYRETHDGKTQTYRVRFRYAGGIKAPVFDLHLKGADWGTCSLILQDSAVSFSTSRPRTALEPPSSIPEFRAVWVDENVPMGDSWDDWDTGTRTVVAAALETVATPAGTYENCLRTVTETLPPLFDSLSARLASTRLTPSEYNSQLHAAQLVVQRWFAPGVGLVKEQLGTPEHVRELVAIVRESRNDRN
jgi:hypothetical protein